MHVLITAGATREPIDDVRFLSNISSGRLGAAVATAFADAGDHVTLLHGEGAVRPAASPRIREVVFGSASSLLRALLDQCGPASATTVTSVTTDGADGEKWGGAPDLLIHAAAVADYAPEPVDGKISSTGSSLVLTLAPTPKVADQVRAAYPDLPIILFKLEARVSEEELVRRAHRTMARVGADAIVANHVGEVGATSHRALLLRSDGTSVEAVTREDIARELVVLAHQIGNQRAEPSR